MKKSLGAIKIFSSVYIEKCLYTTVLDIKYKQKKSCMFPTISSCIASTKIEIKLDYSLQPHYGNQVFGNVYLTAGHHQEVNIAGTSLP